MSERSLFRTPMSIGMLCVAIAGAETMLFYLLVKSYGAGPGTFYVHSFLSCCLLIFLPACIVQSRGDFLVSLLIKIFLFVTVSQVPRVFYSQIYYLMGKSGMTVFFYCWSLMTSVLIGVFAGRALAHAYDKRDLLWKASLWGAAGSIGRVCTALVSVFLQWQAGTDAAQNVENTALLSMLAAVSLILQGAVAAVPMERALQSHS